MQTISREELSWIISAINDRAVECGELLLEHADRNVPLTNELRMIIEKQRENYSVLSNKLLNTYLQEDGRIGIAPSVA